MSGLFHLAWVLPDETRGHMVTPVSREIAERLRDRCEADIASARYFIIAEEEFETWKAQ